MTPPATPTSLPPDAFARGGVWVRRRESPESGFVGRAAPAEPTTLAHAGWFATLAASGFVPGGGPGCFCRGEGGLRACLDSGRWLILTAPVEGGSVPYGLWKPIEPAAGGRPPVFRCDVPLDGMVDGEEAAGTSDGAAAHRAALLAWVLASLAGTADAGWRSPALSSQRLWAAATGLAIQARGDLRQVVLPEPDTEPGRWHVRTLLGRWPHGGALPPERIRWLRQALHHATRSFRMVQAGALPPEPGSAEPPIIAGFDLAGVPAAHAEPLFRAGLEALHLAAHWLVPLTGVLTRPSMPLPALDHASPILLPSNNSPSSTLNPQTTIPCN